MRNSRIFFWVGIDIDRPWDGTGMPNSSRKLNLRMGRCIFRWDEHQFAWICHLLWYRLRSIYQSISISILTARRCCGLAIAQGIFKGWTNRASYHQEAKHSDIFRHWSLLCRPSQTRKKIPQQEMRLLGQRKLPKHVVTKLRLWIWICLEPTLDFKHLKPKLLLVKAATIQLCCTDEVTQYLQEKWRSFLQSARLQATFPRRKLLKAQVNLPPWGEAIEPGEWGTGEALGTKTPCSRVSRGFLDELHRGLRKQMEEVRSQEEALHRLQQQAVEPRSIMIPYDPHPWELNCLMAGWGVFFLIVWGILEDE